MKIYGFENYQPMPANYLNPRLKWKWKPKHWDLIQNPKKLLNYNPKIELFLPKKFHKKHILILNKYKASTGALIRELKKNKIPFAYLNWDEFIHEGSLSFNESTNEYFLEYKKHKINLSQVKSIYFDYFDVVEVFHFHMSQYSDQERIFLARWVDTLRTLQYVCPKAKWFASSPDKMEYDAQNKFAELLLAKKMGLHIPEMIYSNDLKEIKKFATKYKAYLKESGFKYFKSGKETMTFNSGMVLPKDKKLPLMKTSPCMLQNFIEKEYDLRVVVIQNKVFAVKVDSQKDVSSMADWRGREHLVPMTPYKLPKDLEKKLIRYTKELGFQMGCSDLIKGKDGKYYFLEMNRPGQWFYLEVLSGQPIVRALAKALNGSNS